MKRPPYGFVPPPEIIVDRTTRGAPLPTLLTCVIVFTPMTNIPHATIYMQLFARKNEKKTDIDCVLLLLKLEGGFFLSSGIFF
jgi:hypothetical protein